MSIAAPELVRSQPARRLAAGWAQSAVLATPLVVLAALAWSRRWMSDDGFIHLRVVHQILAGHGPVFNVGQRVEASSSPLWVFTLTLADLVIPLRLEWIAVLLGIALTLTGVCLAMAGARSLFSQTGERQLFVPVGAAVLVAVSPVWTFSSSGLEGGLAYAWLGFCFWVLARWARTSRPIGTAAAVVLGVGALIRPELAVFTLLFAAVVLLGGGHDRPAARLRTLAAMAAVPLAYQIFRMGYYGALAPQPAVAKEASRAWWSAGWTYLRAFADPYWLWVPLVVLLAGAYLPQFRALRQAQRWRALLVVGGFAVGAIVDAVYIVRVGGDFMYARLLLPALFAFVAPVAVVPLRTRYLGATLVLPWVVASLFFLRSPADNRGEFATGRHNLVTVEDFGLGEGQPQRRWFTGDGVYFQTTRLDAPPAPGERTPAVAFYGIGITGYALGTNVYILDLLGLADPFTAHLQLARRGLIAHEKPLPAPWIAARLLAPGANVDEGEFPLPTGFGAQRIDAPAGVPFDERVNRARAALLCPTLRRFDASYTAPLTAHRFADNLWHAVSYWRLRIPPEPADAYDRFCRS